MGVSCVKEGTADFEGKNEPQKVDLQKRLIGLEKEEDRRRKLKIILLMGGMKFGQMFKICYSNSIKGIPQFSAVAISWPTLKG